MSGSLRNDEKKLSLGPSVGQGVYMGTSLIRKRTPLEHYRRRMSRVLGGWALSYERGTPVAFRFQEIRVQGKQ